MDAAIAETIHTGVFIFDNDNTLYTAKKDLQTATVGLITQFMGRELGLSETAAAAERLRLLKKHGVRSTIVAWQREGLDVARFIEKTYLAVPLKEFGLAKCRRAFDWIARIHGKKFVMTNSPAAFARRILQEIECVDYFDDIFGIQELGFNEKPSPAAFSIIESNIPHDARIFFVDDKAENVAIAEKVGYLGVLWNCPKCQEGTCRELA
jgi:putative hydrolase of the HAD superfamily